MKKVIIVFCLLVSFTASLAFAENEKKGTIAATFGIGLGFSKIMEIEPQFSFILDVNYINKTGLTLCFTDIISVHSTRPSQNLMFGIGYNYMRDKWNIGGTIMASPTLDDLMLGGKINGGYYFANNIGVNGVVTYRHTAGIGASDFSMFDAFLGTSLRFF